MLEVVTSYKLVCDSYRLAIGVSKNKKGNRKLPEKGNRKLPEKGKHMLKTLSVANKQRACTLLSSRNKLLLNTREYS